MLEEAARVTSPIAHISSSATKVGLAAGAGAVVVAFISGGLGLPAYIGLLSTGMGAGKLLDNYVLDEDGAERIIVGVVHVLLDEAKLQAANASEVTRTDQHDGFVNTGSDSVFIEGFPASRRTDSTSCGGTIHRGSAHIFYGGALTGAAPEQYLSPVLRAVDVGLAIASFKRPKSAWDLFKLTLSATDMAERVGIVEENPVPESVRDIKSTISVIEGLYKRGMDFARLFGG